MLIAADIGPPGGLSEPLYLGPVSKFLRTIRRPLRPLHTLPTHQVRLAYPVCDA